MVNESSYLSLFILFVFSRAGNSGGSGPSGIQRHIVPATQTYFEVTNLAVPQPSFYEVWLTATNRAGIGDKSKVLRHSPGFKGTAPQRIMFATPKRQTTF